MRITSRAKAITGSDSGWRLNWQAAVCLGIALLGLFFAASHPPAVDDYRGSGDSRPPEANIIADIAKRPSWPYGWMRLAKLFVETGRYDQLDGVLKRVQYLGPNEPALKFHQALLALRFWQADLPAYSFQVLHESLVSERRNHPWPIQAYAYLAQRERIYCELPMLNARETYWCNQMRYARRTCQYLEFLDEPVRKWCDYFNAQQQNFLRNWRFWIQVPMNGNG